MKTNRTFYGFARACRQAITTAGGLLLSLAAGWMLLASASFAGPADRDNVVGYVEFDVDRKNMQSCVAYPSGNRLVIAFEAFEYTDQDLEAYLKQGVYRDIALVDVAERHTIPEGYQRHPGISIALIFEQAVAYETAAIIDSDVGLSGTGKQGDLHTGLLGRHYDVKVGSLSENFVSGTLRSVGGSYRFQIDFECPVVQPAQ